MTAIMTAILKNQNLMKYREVLNYISIASKHGKILVLKLQTGLHVLEIVVYNQENDSSNLGPYFNGLTHCGLQLWDLGCSSH